ncbi:FKBP-type peptidyl-prolyl cis-trans isomerase FkpA [Paraburkholderia sp. MM5496-R1]|uniref:Peptidyl-prolyl cis-trans isomerase n=2 Tax=Burkholderiaceae TaxID=119060 RepID=A0A1H1JCS7_9BURK|nr:FKBP-type peptidyl-prolyl cis-trans isomerase FkpA [Paraburkholderia tuberum]
MGAQRPAASGNMWEPRPTPDPLQSNGLPHWRFALKSLVALLAAAVLSSTAMAAAPTTEKLPSGVIVEHLTQGTGPQPSATDVVKVNYRGTLPNGTEFDSSAKHGGPATFPLNRVIPCWTQGVQKMKVGGKARLTCPAATAYGDRGVGPIPPNTDLTFEVELVDIVK